MSRAKTIADWVTTIISLIVFPSAFFISRWLGVPGNWPWLVAFLAVPIVGRLTRRMVMEEAIKTVTKEQAQRRAGRQGR